MFDWFVICVSFWLNTNSQNMCSLKTYIAGLQAVFNCSQNIASADCSSASNFVDFVVSLVEVFKTSARLTRQSQDSCDCLVRPLVSLVSYEGNRRYAAAMHVGVQFPAFFSINVDSQ